MNFMNDEWFRPYSITLVDQVLGAAPIDIVSIIAGANRLLLLGVYIDNVDGIAVAGEANEFYNRLEIIRGYTAPGSGGSVFTVLPVIEGDPTPPGFTVRTMDTVLASVGTPVTVHAGALASRSGFFYPPVKAARIGASTSLIIRLPTALSFQMNCNVTVYVAEYSNKNLDVMRVG